MDKPTSRPDRWENHYSILTQKDRDNPIKTLQNICTFDHLFNQRDKLSEMFRAATQSEAWEGDDPSAKSDSLFFYSTTLHLWEIACRINEMIEHGQLLFAYPNKGDDRILSDDEESD